MPNFDLFNRFNVPSYFSSRRKDVLAQNSVYYIQNGKLAELQAVQWEIGWDVNARFNDLTLLEHALYNRKANIAVWLIDKGANVNPQTKDMSHGLKSAPPIDLAIHFNMLRVFDKLYKAGAKSNIVSSDEEYFFCKAIIAINVKAADDIIYPIIREANINHIGVALASEGNVLKPHQTTILQYAIENNNIPLAKWVIANTDVNPNIKLHGKTAVDSAVEHLKLGVLDMLVEKGANIPKHKHYQLQIQILKGLGQYEKAQKLIDEKTEIFHKFTDNDYNILIDIENTVRDRMTEITDIEHIVNEVRSKNTALQSSSRNKKSTLRKEIRELRKELADKCGNDEDCTGKINEIKSELKVSIENSPTYRFIEALCADDGRAFVVEEICQRNNDNSLCSGDMLSDLSVCEVI